MTASVTELRPRQDTARYAIALVSDLTPQARQERLEKLAADVRDNPDLADASVSLGLLMWCHPSLSEEDRNLWFDTYVEAVAKRDGIALGDITWQEAYPELTCADQQEAAWQWACAETHEALGVLVHGRMGTR